MGSREGREIKEQGEDEVDIRRLGVCWWATGGDRKQREGCHICTRKKASSDDGLS